MSTARSILEERLARGEISDEEFDRLSAKLSGVIDAPLNKDAASPVKEMPESTLQSTKYSFSTTETDFPNTATADTPKKSNKQVWIGVGIGSVLALVAIANSGADRSGLSIGNLGGTARSDMTFTIANTSDRADDVIVWANLKGREICLTIFSVKARTRYSVRIPCQQMEEGDFNLSYGWADSYQSKSVVARRINLN